MSSKTEVVAFGNDSVWKLNDHPEALYWTCTLAVDGDGDPKCYHPAGSPPGLDYLANAGSPGNWWGIACHPPTTGTPYIQTATDPAPGFYVSTTALLDGSWPESNPNRYVNAGEVPFIVLPSNPKFDPKQTLGDLAVCFNNSNGKACGAIYADIGPSNHLGEGSIALAAALGIPSSPKTGGTEEEIVAMIYWPGSTLGWPKSFQELRHQACQLFKAWGGYVSAKEAMPQFNWEQFPKIPTPGPIPTPPAPQVVTITVNAPPGVTVNVVQTH